MKHSHTLLIYHVKHFIYQSCFCCSLFYCPDVGQQLGGLSVTWVLQDAFLINLLITSLKIVHYRLNTVHLMHFFKAIPRISTYTGFPSPFFIQYIFIFNTYSNFFRKYFPNTYISRAKKLFKCRTLVTNLTIKCPFPKANVSLLLYTVRNWLIHIQSNFLYTHPKTLQFVETLISEPIPHERENFLPWSRLWIRTSGSNSSPHESKVQIFVPLEAPCVLRPGHEKWSNIRVVPGREC